MSDKQTQNSNSEEVDLGQLFNAIGRIFERFFKFIGSIFKAVFSIFLLALKAIIVNFKIIAIVIIAAFIAGVVYERTQEPVYFGRMLVEPYFESKYQLASNIDYYNSLINNGNIEELASLFDIQKDDATQLVNFSLDAGPETENDLLKEYDSYLNTIDSTRAKNTTFKDYKENRDLFSSSIFSIEVKSFKRDIFRDLNEGFENSFENDYSKTLRTRRDSTIALKKRIFKRNLKQLDSMKLVYLSIKEEESKSGSGRLSIQGMMPISQEKADTKEYELLQNELRLRDSLRVLDQQIIEENVYYDVISRFPELGSRDNSIFRKYKLIFPILAFVLLSLLFLGIKTIKFIKSYE